MTSTPTRNLELTGVLNFRDLGGYLTADGRSVRWRTLFRADGLGHLTSDDLEALRPIGLRTVVDLRTIGELERRGRFPVDAYPVAFHHLSVIDRTWDLDQAIRENLPTIEFLHRSYHQMLDQGAGAFAAAFEALSGPDALPAVFHCAAGKDRTGLLAALLLGALGVGHDDIVDDYTLTQEIMDRLVDRSAAEDPEIADRVARAPRSFYTADPGAMSRILGDLEREHGSIRGFVRWTGVSDDVLARLETLLLSDA